MEDNLYDILGVPPGASGDEIRAAYRRLTKLYHPDRGGTPLFFRQLQDAYYVLSDAKRRSAYDTALRTGNDVSIPGEHSGTPNQPAGPGPSPEATNKLFSNALRQFVADLSRASNLLAGRYKIDTQHSWLAAIWLTLVFLGIALLVVLVVVTDGLVLLFLVVVGAAYWVRQRILGD